VVFAVNDAIEQFGEGKPQRPCETRQRIEPRIASSALHAAHKRPMKLGLLGERLL